MDPLTLPRRTNAYGRSQLFAYLSNDERARHDTAAYREEQLAAGPLLMARAYLPDEPTLQLCYIEDFTARAAMPPAWRSVGDVWFDLQPPERILR